MYSLGIETSCDETAVAILDYDAAKRDHNPTKNTSAQPKSQTKILANLVYSQIKEHAAFGGVVPEIAARSHVCLLDNLIEEALKKAKIPKEALDLIAVTQGPGLVGGLIVGLMSAKALALGLNIPFIGVNHLEGHALSARLVEDIPFPYLLLLVSGGHTQIILVETLGCYHRIGSTIDDALGEAFDKSAKLMGLPYPGGPQIEQHAKKGNGNAFALPRPMIKEDNLILSFSGLKTAMRQRILTLQKENHQIAGEATLTQTQIADLCASFQEAVSELLHSKLKKAFEIFCQRYPNSERNFVVAGGVGANLKIRTMLKALCEDYHFSFFAPPPEFCTDNAAMIALAGVEHFLQGTKSDFSLAPRSRWPLDEASSPLIGAGRRGMKA